MHQSLLTQQARSAAKREMVKGFFWFAAAALVTTLTYSAAEPGGTYLVFWGALAYGCFRFLRAVYYWLNPPALLKRAGRTP